MRRLVAAPARLGTWFDGQPAPLRGAIWMLLSAICLTGGAVIFAASFYLVRRGA